MQRYSTVLTFKHRMKIFSESVCVSYNFQVPIKIDCTRWIGICPTEYVVPHPTKLWNLYINLDDGNIFWILESFSDFDYSKIRLKRVQRILTIFVSSLLSFPLFFIVTLLLLFHRLSQIRLRDISLSCDLSLMLKFVSSRFSIRGSQALFYPSLRLAYRS